MQCVSPIAESVFFKDYLDAAGIENYIPMRYEYVVRKERRLRKLVPAVHNPGSFVRLQPRRAYGMKIKNEPGHELPHPAISWTAETRQPIVSRTHKMRSFIAVSGTTTRPCSILNPPS
mgnify:CR=1 FL=1